MRRLLLALPAVIGILSLLPAQAGARTVQLSEAQGATFPDKAFVLTLPHRQSLQASDLQVTENGQPVRNLTVTPGSAAGPKTFGVILAIDSSLSMHGQPILDAMAAARDFAARRQPNEQLGVIFFNHSASVAVPLTGDESKIDAVLAAAPTLRRGTRIFDAAGQALRALSFAGVSVGSVVMLSDGADVGSQASLASVAGAARQRHIRVFTVGLRSPSFDRSSLAGLAMQSNGSYAEAASSRALAGIYAALAERLGNEYLVRYQSLSTLGSRVRVTATVAGLGTASATYAAPPVPPSLPPAVKSVGIWDSTGLLAGVAAAIALLLGLIVYALAGPKAPNVRRRVAYFIPEPERLDDLLGGPEEESGAVVLRAAEARLSRSRIWTRFKEDIDVGRIEAPPIQIVLAAAVVALGGVLLSAIFAHSVGLAVLFAISPAIPMVWVRTKADRQRRAFDEQLPDNLQVIASAMRAGQSFVGAMSIASRDADEPSKSEFQRIVADEQLGVPLADAMRNVAQRMRSTEFEYVGLVAQLQRSTGGNTAEVIDRVTETIRERAQLRRTIRTLTAQGRFSGAVVSFLPLGLALVISITKPHYLDPMFHRPAAVAALVLAGVGILSGWLIIRRIVDIKV